MLIGLNHHNTGQQTQRHKFHGRPIALNTLIGPVGPQGPQGPQGSSSSMLGGRFFFSSGALPGPNVPQLGSSGVNGIVLGMGTSYQVVTGGPIGPIAAVGGFSIPIPAAGTIDNLQVSVDVTAPATPEAAIEWNFEIYRAAGNNPNIGVGAASSDYIATGLSCQVMLSSDGASNTQYTTTKLQPSSPVAVNPADRLVMRVTYLAGNLLPSLAGFSASFTYAA